jgi:hypothetical protein
LGNDTPTACHNSAGMARYDETTASDDIKDQYFLF